MSANFIVETFIYDNESLDNIAIALDDSTLQHIITNKCLNNAIADNFWTSLSFTGHHCRVLHTLHLVPLPSSTREMQIVNIFQKTQIILFYKNFCKKYTVLTISYSYNSNSYNMYLQFRFLGFLHFLSKYYGILRTIFNRCT